MKSLRFLGSFSTLALFILTAALVVAQSKPVARDDPQWSAPFGAQAASAQGTAQLAPAGQKLQAHFAPAVAYGSGAPYASSVAVADLNGDGIPDLAVADWCLGTQYGYCDAQGEVAVLLGNGDGTFQAAVIYPTGAYFAYSVAIGDVNGDGIPDLVVVDYCQSLDRGGGCQDDEPGAVSVLVGNGNGTFQPAVTYNSGGLSAYSVAVGDLNGDGKLDLAIANSGALDNSSVGSVGVLVGNGDGTFQSAVSYSTGGYVAASVAIGDLNGDEIPDLVVTDFCQSSGCYPDNGRAGVLLGNGNGTFQPVALYDSGGVGAYSVAIADLTGNGILDLVVANRFSDGGCCDTPGAVGVLRGNGDGTFQPPISYVAAGREYLTYPSIGWGIGGLIIGDLNGDGHPDLAVVEECKGLRHYTECLTPGQVNLMLGNGDGSFQRRVVYGSSGSEGSAIAIGDVNGDGRPDLVVTNACGNDESCSGADGSVAALLNRTSYASKTALAASPNPARVSQTVTFTATITPTPPDGEVVAFSSGKTSLGMGTTKNGVASLTTSFPKAKTYTIKANYPGDAFRKKSSGTVKLVVNP